MIRAAYLAAAERALDAASDPLVDARRAEPSALPEMTVEMLAAHLLRSVLVVEEYLDLPVPDEPPIDAPAYWLAFDGLRDPDSPVSRRVRERAAAQAAVGLGELRATARATLDRLRERLDREPAGCRLVALGHVMLLDEYLRTRLVELTVHLDDLAVSLGLPPFDVPPDATGEAIRSLLEVARRSHGDLAVLRALTRQERDAGQALRVL